MSLDGSQVEQLHAALLSAFPTRSELERMLLFKLNVRLDEIAAESCNNLDTAMCVIKWAEAQGRIDTLIHGARAENPGNPLLGALGSEFGSGQHNTAGERQPIHLPYQSLDTLFKGRDEVLEQLDRSLDAPARRVAAVVGKAVHGLGGVGKTRLAVEYAWRQRERYSALLFIPADSPELLRSSLAALVAPRILNLPEQDVPEEQSRADATVRWLQDHPGWLVILDNADTEEAAIAVETLLPELYGGCVLITSRLARWSAAVASLELDVLELEAAANFLLARTENYRQKCPADLTDALALARELDGLALALEQAGAYIAAERISLAEYLHAWRTHGSEVQKWYDQRLMKYRCSIAVTWQVTMERLGPSEVGILRVLCWFAPEPIPIWVFEGEEVGAVWQKALDAPLSYLVALNRMSSWLWQRFPSPVHGRQSKQCHLTTSAALRRLIDYGMLREDVQGEVKTVSIHRVVQEVVRTRASAAERKLSLTRSLRILESLVARDDPSDALTWPRWKLLQAHVAAAIRLGDTSEFGKVTEVVDLTTHLMGLLGILLETMSLGPEAEALERRALSLDETRLGPTHPMVALRINNLAITLLGMDRLTEAEMLMQRAVDIYTRSSELAHPDLIKSFNNLAVMLMNLGRLEDAEAILRQILLVQEQELGPFHSDVAISLGNLARVLRAADRQAEVEGLIVRAINIDEKNLGLDHPRVAEYLGFWGELLHDMNQLEEAEELMRRALAIEEQSLGPSDPEVATSLSNLAQLLCTMGKWDEAELLMRRILAICEQHFEADHPSIGLALNNLGGLLRDTGRLVEAAPLFRQSVCIYLGHTKRTGYPHSDRGKALRNYAGLLRALGNAEDSIRADIATLVGEYEEGPGA